MAVAGAAALLASLLTPTAATADDDPTTLDDLLISEYVEGSSNNKALELYNGTAAGIDLAGYVVEQYSNGGTSANPTVILDGTVEAGGTFVLAHSSSAPAILDRADQTTGAGLFNGDDALVLRGPDGSVVDSFGQIGVDPGTSWGTPSTVDNTLRRDADVCTGDTDPEDAFDPSAGWTGFGKDVFDGLGSHTTSCAAGDPDPDPDPGEPGDPVCEQDVTPVGDVQGAGDASPMKGLPVTVRGTVVGDFPDFDGFFLQDGGDGDDATSDGIFVYTPAGADVSVGDTVAVTGTVGENFTVTQLREPTYEVCATGTELPAPTEVTLPLLDHERYESMYITLPQDLAIQEYYNYGRYGEIVLGLGDGTNRQYQPTAVYEPGSPEAVALAEHNAAHRITLDDGLGSQNPAFLRHPNGQEFTLENRFRGGDLVTGATGVLDYRFSLWRLQPTEGAGYTSVNDRPGVPEVGGTTTVGSFNVLNYFTTLTSEDRDARGADTPEEFVRQQAKIVAAINEMDADVVGLIEIENNGDVAVGSLVDALNAAAGADRWDFVPTGVIGTDAITTAFIYQPAEVAPVGAFAVLDESVDARFDTSKNRPALAQTFTDLVEGGAVTVVVNHLKSKGSSCASIGDPEDPDGQGNCNLTRQAAADALGDWANDDPTGTGTDGALIIGDLNSYDKEDPIDALKADGYSDLLLEHGGELAYSYVFDGMLGYLDYAMASQTLQGRVTGAQAWHINADEPSVLDYDMSYKKPAQDALYAPDPYRSSDHDPVLVGLELDQTAPELEVVVEPPHIWPANGRWRNVTTAMLATDDSGMEPTVTLVGATTVGGEIETLDDHSFRVLATQGATYTLTYEATDAAGNTTTRSVTVEVARPGRR